LGIALGQWISDNDDRYIKGTMPGHYNNRYIPGCQAMGWMMADGYLEDAGALACPSFKWRRPRRPHLEACSGYSPPRNYGACVFPEDAPLGTHHQHGEFTRFEVGAVHEVCYFLDEGRIHPKSKPERVVAADGIEMCTWWGLEPANHTDGSNLLFLDIAVKWQPTVDAGQRYTKDQVGCREGSGWSSSSYNYYAASDLDDDSSEVWVRYGYVPNPRLDEDECFEATQEAGEPDIKKRIIYDKDDIYECEGASPMAIRFVQTSEFGMGSPSTDQEAYTPDYQRKTEMDDSGWYSMAPACRFYGDFSQEEVAFSMTDCAVGGGQIFHRYAGANSSNPWHGWRNGSGYMTSSNRGWYYYDDPDGNSNYDYCGWTWGVPIAYEEDVF
jgi:hypothetical protein